MAPTTPSGVIVSVEAQPLNQKIGTTSMLSHGIKLKNRWGYPRVSSTLTVGPINLGRGSRYDAIKT